MFTTKYQPRSIEEFAGNAAVVQALQQWLRGKQRKKQVALLCGPPGIGKTCLARLLLSEALSPHINVFDVSLDERDAASLRRFIQPTSQVPMDCFGKQNVLFLDDLDIGETLPLSLFKQTRVPILAICQQDTYPLKSLLPLAEVFRLQTPSFQEVYPLLYRVVSEEGMHTSLKRLQKWHEDARGDVRYLLNMMQVNIAPDKRMPSNSSCNVFDTTAQLLNVDLSLREKETWYQLYPELHPAMLQENLPRGFLGAPGLAVLRHMEAGTQHVSDSDLFARLLPEHECCALLAATLHGCKRGVLRFPTVVRRNAHPSGDATTLRRKS